MLSAEEPEPTNEEEKTFDLPEGLSPQEELRHLKMKHGSWNLAPQLVSAQTMFDKDLIAEVGRPLWTSSTEFTTTTHTPQQFQDYVIKMSCGEWRLELQALVGAACFDVGVLKKLYYEPGLATPANLQTHQIPGEACSHEVQVLGGYIPEATFQICCHCRGWHLACQDSEPKYAKGLEVDLGS